MSYQPAPRPERGLLPWALGFIALLPIPAVGLLAAGIAMAACYPSQRSRGLLAEANARRAGNWGLTMVALTVVVVAVVVTIFTTQLLPDRTLPGGLDQVVLGLVAVQTFGLGLLHLIMVLIGTLKASGGGVFRAPAIPFLRDRAAR